MKKDYLHSPILITGASRSGTSMVGGIINLCGAFGGTMSLPNKDVKKGMFENLQILNTLVKPYLNEIGVDQFGQYPLPDVNSLRIPVSWAENVLKIITEQGYATGQWMYKGTQMNLLFPIWDYAFPNAKWIIVRRKDDDIVESCLHTAFMNAFDNEENVKAVGAKDKKDAWYWWVRQHNKRFSEMIEKGLNCKQIHPERMVYGDYSQMQEMIEWLGLKWNSEILDFIEPKIFKTRNSL
jgi:hypothetical protein